MNYKLRTLFVITLLTALLLASVVQDRRMQHDVQRLAKAVDETLVSVGLNTPLVVSKREHRNDFILFSSGNVGRDVKVGDRTEVYIDLTWKSRVLFSQIPSIVLTHGDNTAGFQFAENFIWKFQEQYPGVFVDSKLKNER